MCVSLLSREAWAYSQGPQEWGKKKSQHISAFKDSAGFVFANVPLAKSSYILKPWPTMGRDYPMVWHRKRITAVGFVFFWGGEGWWVEGVGILLEICKLSVRVPK